jgi:hypothetical protein
MNSPVRCWSLWLMGTLLVFGVGLSDPGAAMAQIKAQSKGDARVRAALVEAGLTFQENKDGDFRLLYNVAEGRTHLCIVSSQSYRLDPFEVREIFASAWKSSQPPSRELANRMLKENSVKKVGAWQLVHKDGGDYLLVFVAKVDVQSDGEALKTTIQAVVDTADKMEKELTNADEF